MYLLFLIYHIFVLVLATALVAYSIKQQGNTIFSKMNLLFYLVGIGAIVKIVYNIYMLLGK
jgi:hypothetical protein